MDRAEDVGCPDGEHDQEDGSGEICGAAASEAGCITNEEQQHVDCPHDEGGDDLGVAEVGCAESGILSEDHTYDEADGHAGKAEEQRGVRDALEVVEGWEPVECAWTGAGKLGFDAAGLDSSFLHQIQQRGEDAEAEGGVCGEQGHNVRYEPADANAGGGKDVSIYAKRGDEDDEKGDGQGEDAERNGFVQPPDEKKRSGDEQGEERFGVADADGKPAMGGGEHFHDGDEVEEEGQASKVEGGFAPALAGKEHGRKDSDASRCVQHRRYSEPK